MREKDGASLFLDATMTEAALALQEAHFLHDPWEERIASFVGQDGDIIIATEVAWEMVGVESGRRTQGDNNRMGEIMKRLVFEKTKMSIRGREVRCYFGGNRETAARFSSLHEFKTDDL